MKAEGGRHRHYYSFDQRLIFRIVMFVMYVNGNREEPRTKKPRLRRIEKKIYTKNRRRNNLAPQMQKKGASQEKNKESVNESEKSPLQSRPKRGICPRQT